MKFTEECRKKLKTFLLGNVYRETDEGKEGECLLLLTHDLRASHNNEIILRNISVCPM
jgi:hypothetical protein